MNNLPHPPALANVSPECPVCHGAGVLVNPFSTLARDWLDCPCCNEHEARWTTQDCLPISLFTDESAA